jgi:hypothetical protein
LWHSCLISYNSLVLILCKNRVKVVLLSSYSSLFWVMKRSSIFELCVVLLVKWEFVGFQWKSARQFLLVIGCVWWEIGYLMVYLYSDSILCVVWEFFFFFEWFDFWRTIWFCQIDQISSEEKKLRSVYGFSIINVCFVYSILTVFSVWLRNVWDLRLLIEYCVACEWIPKTE